MKMFTSGTCSHKICKCYKNVRAHPASYMFEIFSSFSNLQSADEADFDKSNELPTADNNGYISVFLFYDAPCTSV